MANITMHSTFFLFVILFCLLSAEAFIHRFRYERETITLSSYAAKYPSILPRDQNVTTPGRNSTGNSSILGGNSTIGGNSTTPGVRTWISLFSTPAQNSTPKAQPSPVANSTTPGVSNKFSTPAQSSTPKAQPSPAANLNGSSQGTPHPTSTFTSGKSPGHTGTSAKSSTPTSKPTSAATSAKSSTSGKASQTTSHPDSPSSAQSPPPNASSPGSLPTSIPSSHVSTGGSPATTLQPTSAPNPHTSHGDTSGTDLPISTGPSSTGSVGPSETSNATIFPVLFGGLYKNRNTVLDDDKHKTDYVNQIQDSRTKIKTYLDDLPDKPDTNSVQCSSSKRKRSLISDIAGFAGNIGKLVTCADQLLDNLDGVVRGVHPSINDIDTLTGAINVIGDDINTDNTNDNQPSSAKQSAPSTAKPTSTDPISSTSPPSSAHSTTAPSSAQSTTTPSTAHTTTTPSTAHTTTTPSSAHTTTTPSIAQTTTTPSSARTTTTPSTAHTNTTPSTVHTTTTPSTHTTTPSTTRPQSSCTQTAVSRCTEILSISTSYFPSSSGSTVFTITATSCVTTSACSGTATIMTTTVSETSTPTGSSRPLLIIRDFNETDETVIKQFEQELTDQLGVGNFNTTRGSPQLGVVFWTARLNSSQVEEFSNSSAVSGIVEDQALSTTGWAPYDLSGPYSPPQSTNTSDISKRVNGSRLISQNDALASLRVVSQPHNVTIIDLTDNYKYNSAAGSGITVYLIDTGANPQNSEYYLMPGTKRWMFPQNAGEPGVVLRTQSDEQNHGSCVLSKIAGPRYGVAKGVDVVIVKVPTAAMQDTVMASGMLELLAEVSEDIAKNKLQGKAVINFSGGIYLPVTGFDPTRLSYLATLRDILRMDVPVVCTAGNFGEDVAIEHWPAAYADRYDGIIVVGASNNDGIHQDFSQTGPVVSVHAPGFNVTCADSKQDDIIRYSGTSLAAPAVAGLAAYFMSMPEFKSEIQQQGRVAGNVKRLITRLAYPRHGDVPVLWNGENSDSCVNFQRRDGSSAKVCSARASTKPTSTKPASTKPISKATSTDGVKTSHHTQPPPITRCKAVSAPAKTIAGSTFTATSYCTCNDGWLVDLGTTVGTDHNTTYICNVGTKTTMAVSTEAGTTTTSAVPVGTCNAHVSQQVAQRESDAPPVSLTVNITDKNAAHIGYKSGNLNWANNFNVDSALPWVLVLTPTTGDPDDNGQDGQNRPEWRDGPLDFAYSHLTWDSNSANCFVGKYDDSFTRVMDCRFRCP